MTEPTRARTTGLLGWLVAHAGWVVTVVVIVSLGLGLAATRLSLEFHPGDLLPQGHPFIAVHNRYHRNFSEANTLTIMVEAREGTIFTLPLLTTIYRMTEAVDGLPGVNHDQVTSVAHRSTRWARVRAGGLIESSPIMLGLPKTQADVDEVRHEVIQSYAFGSMVSLDQRAAVIRAGFDERRLDYRRLFDAVNARIIPFADEHAAIHVSGQPRLNGWILHLEGQVLTAFAAAVVLTWLCLWVYFRDWRGALRPTISGGLAALWGFGLMWLTGFALNPLTLVIPFLITARAVSHSAQMHDRYYEELAGGAEKRGAIGSAFVGLFAPTLAGILTDALGVLAIGIVGIPALRQLAVTATFWLLSLIVTELLLNPIVYTHLRAPEIEKVRAREHGRFAHGLGRLADAVLAPRGRWVTLAAGASVLAVSVALLPWIRIGDPESASRVLAAGAEYNRSHHAVQEAFGGNEPFMVVAEGDRPGALQEAGVLRTIEAFQRYLERTPVVGASFSLVDILKSMGELFHELEPKWGVIPSNERDIRTMFFTYWGSVFPSTAAQYFTPDFSTAHITFFCHDHTLEHVRQLVTASRTFIAAHPLDHVQFRLAGGFVGIMAAVYDEILRSQALMTAASFLVIFVIVAVTYRSLVAATLLVLPLVVANAIVNGYMAARGIGLDVNTLPVIAVGVGFGIDYGIYILSRVQEATATGASLPDAVREGVVRAGRPVAFTALTMTAGVLCFTPTALRFVGEMAALLALWMATSAATALVLLPALLVVIRPRFLSRSQRSVPGTLAA
jgi:uncharacterized protein